MSYSFPVPKHDDGMIKYASVDDVPDQLVRTPLQRAIQLMKRHRDIRFSEELKFKPISIIITTLAAHLYHGERDVFTTLTNIVDLLVQHAGLVEDRYTELNEKIAAMRLITRNSDGEWCIPNPVNHEENFADKWHEENHARARAFFKWVEWLREDITELSEAGTKDNLIKNIESVFGESVATSIAERLPATPLDESAISRIVQTTPAHTSVSWKQHPKWPLQIEQEFELDARLSREKGHRPYAYRYINRSKRLDKYIKIKFTAPSFRVECLYYWQVTNTGDEARKSGDLRGGFRVDGRIHTESTKYSGDHVIQCFVVKNGVCIAKSHEFVVRII